MDNLTNDDLAYIKLVLISNGSGRARDIASKIPNPHHKKMVKKMKAVIDNEPAGIETSKKPYRTKPDYPAR